MARFTVDDCMYEMNNRFDMTLAAAIRARQIVTAGMTFLDNEENDKATVLALREIAGGFVDSDVLQYVE